MGAKGSRAELDHLSIFVVIALPFARIAATSFSIGTGGSGGVFGPGMVIGAFTGLAVWRLLEPFAPGVGHSPAPFVVVGMMATFGGISRAPIAVMLMVTEMTGSVGVLGPAMVAVAIAWFIVGRADDSIYRSQLRTRADSAAGRFGFGLPLLATLKVADVARPPLLTLADRALAVEALAALRDAGVPGAAVVDARGSYVGTVEADRLDKLAAAHPGATLGAAVDRTTATVAASATLDVGLDALVQAGGRWVPVTGGTVASSGPCWLTTSSAVITGRWTRMPGTSTTSLPKLWPSRNVWGTGHRWRATRSATPGSRPAA